MAIGSRDQPMVLDSDEDGSGGALGGYGYAPRKRVKLEPVKKEASMAYTHISAGGEEKEGIRDELRKLDDEIDDVQAQLEPLQALLVSLQAERSELERRLHASASSSRSKAASSSSHSNTLNGSHHHGAHTSMINYQTDTFPWSQQLLPVAKRTFDISQFRLCQEGVINAAMDGRDIVCVMPTGGGKSLTYQLPAVMGKGVTVVISPLLALIWDQCRALTEAGVKSVMLTGNVSQSEQSRIMRELEEGADDPVDDIRLCYVTPEKVSKSKRFVSSLQKLYSAGRLKRFVIDEAHCCSQLGHDFRPDYKDLSKLKSLFPRTPIQAVTATLSSKTLPDLLKILQLPKVVSAQAAPLPNKTIGTVFFTAPLYRPNLHYKVLSKPPSAKGAVEAMSKWITENRPGQSGIIYCLSKKDTEEVAVALQNSSNGTIKTGVYHAGIDDTDKERIHTRWRQGKINCICATIAFGLGIDKGDVRYVIHHSLSKSLDGYYQETGRAGRDGQDSDCILFFRAQDSTRLASVMTGVPEEKDKLREMIDYAQDVKTCRKIKFAKYFSTSAQLSANAWDNAADLASTDTGTGTGTGTSTGGGRGGGNVTTCGKCDNCLRDPETLQTRDVTLDAWKILHVAQYVNTHGGRLTASGLVDLARGLGGGKFAVMERTKRGKSRSSGEGFLDLGGLVGDKVGMNKDDTETLVLDLILSNYLKEYYVQTAYAMNVYIQPDDRAYRLTRLSRDRIENSTSGGGTGLVTPTRCTFVVPLKAARKGAGKKVKAKMKVVEISDGEGDPGGSGDGEGGDGDGGDREVEDAAEDDDKGDEGEGGVAVGKKGGGGVSSSRSSAKRPNASEGSRSNGAHTKAPISGKTGRLLPPSSTLTSPTSPPRPAKKRKTSAHTPEYVEPSSTSPPSPHGTATVPTAPTANARTRAPRTARGVLADDDMDEYETYPVYGEDYDDYPNYRDEDYADEDGNGDEEVPGKDAHVRSLGAFADAYSDDEM